MNDRQTEPTRTIPDVAAELQLSSDAIEYHRAKLNVGLTRDERGRRRLTPADVEAIRERITTAKRGWPKGRSREGQTARWTDERRAQQAEVMRGIHERRRKV